MAFTMVLTATTAAVVLASLPLLMPPLLLTPLLIPHPLPQPIVVMAASAALALALAAAPNGKLTAAFTSEVVVAAKGVALTVVAVGFGRFGGIRTGA